MDLKKFTDPKTGNFFVPTGEKTAKSGDSTITTTSGFFGHYDGNIIGATFFWLRHLPHLSLDVYPDGWTNVVFCQRCDKGFWWQ